MLDNIYSAISSGKRVDDAWLEESYDDNPDRSQGARKFKKAKKRHKTADKSRRVNRRKR